MRDYFATRRFNLIDVLGFIAQVIVFLEAKAAGQMLVGVVIVVALVFVTAFISVTVERWDNFKQMWKDIYGD